MVLTTARNQTKDRISEDVRVLPDQSRQALRPGIKKGGIKCSDAESLHRTLTGTS